MAEIKTIIRADSTQHNETVKKSANEIYKYQKKVDDAKKSLSSMVGTVGKFAGALGIALGAGKLLLDNFKQLETASDGLKRTQEQTNTAVKEFLISLETGSFDKFLDGLRDIAKEAGNAYDALDNLRTFQSFNSLDLAKNTTAQQDAELLIKKIKAGLVEDADGTLLKETQAELERLQKQRLTIISSELDYYDKAIEAQEGKILAKFKNNPRALELYYKFTENGASYTELGDALKAAEEKYLNLKNEGLNAADMGDGVNLNAGAYNEWYKAHKAEMDAAQAEYDILKHLAELEGDIVAKKQLQIEKEQTLQKITSGEISNVKLLSGGGKTGGSGTSNKGGSTNTLPTFESGSLADLKSQLKDLKDIYENVNLSIEEGAENLRKQHELEQQITDIENKRAGIITEEITPALDYEVGSLSDLKAQLSSLKEIYENKNLSIEEGSENLRKQKEIEEQINEIEKQRAGIIDEIKVAMLDLDKVASSFGETASAIGSIFNSLGEIAGETDGQMLKMFGDISGHISNILPKIFSLIAANEGEALAAGTASAASLPFPYNLGAIASIVAELVAVFATISSYSGKFAEGGIVGGNSTIGDYNLARVNKGEMILNGKQQAHLFNMLNGIGVPSNNGVSGDVVFRISGNDLVGTLNNYNKRMGRVN